MKRFFLFLAAFLLLIIPLSSRAFFADSDEFAKVAAGEIVQGDYIKIARTITVEGNIDGDVIVLANTLNVSGKVSGDIIGAVSSLNISGQVLGDVRMAANTARISGSIDKNLNILAFAATLEKDSVVRGNAYLNGRDILLNGTIGKNTVIQADRAQISGTIGQDAIVSINGFGKATLGDSSVVGGDVTHKAKEKDQLEVIEGAVVSGQTQFEPFTHERVKNKLTEAFTFGKIISTFGMLVIGLVIISLMPKAAIKLSDIMSKSIGKNILIGLLIFIVTPVVMIALLLTVIGIPLAMILLPLYAISLYFAKVFAGIALGIFVYKKLSKASKKKTLLMPMIVGIVLLSLFTAFPYIGPLINIIAVLWALGALYAFKKGILMEWR